jgi:Icc-related predicted phosphoesterase
VSEPRRVGSNGGRDAAPPPRNRRASDRDRDRVRIAAVGDFHCGVDDVGAYRAAFARVNEEADVLLLAGDLTRWGTPEEMKVALGELADVTIPICAVLGNHDFESGKSAELCTMLHDHGVHHLDGDTYQVDERLSIAGVKGYMGGFGRGTLTAFGEPQTKTFVESCLHEAQKLELALRRLDTPVRVALLHYAPVLDTVRGEPEQIWAFLGTDRLAEPLDRYRASVAFHGHAHIGSFRGETKGGVPVFNVSHALLRRDEVGEMYYVHEVEVSAEAEAHADEVEAVSPS